MPRTSQGSREQEVCPIFLDQALCDLLKRGAPPQQPDVTEELGGQRQRGAQEIPPLHGEVVHLPAAKLPAGNKEFLVQRCDIQRNFLLFCKPLCSDDRLRATR